jgi:hypothetical protein
MFLSRPINKMPLPPLCALLCACLLNCAGTGGGYDDACAPTIQPQVSVDITYTVKLFRHTPTDPTPRPLANYELFIETWKKLCEGGTKGYMVFDHCFTNASGTFQFTVGYNLHNSKDAVEVSVRADPGSANDSISYSQAAASGGTMQRTIIVDILSNGP